MKKIGSILTALVCGGVISGAAEREAFARTYSVTPTSACSLVDAVKAVNSRVQVNSCAAGNGSSASPDIINLQGGSTRYLIPGSLTINTNLILRAANPNNVTNPARAILAQNGPPSDTQNGGIIVVDLPAVSSAMNVHFQDLDLKGTDGVNAAVGLIALGNDTSDMLTLTRCWVEHFGRNGILDQNVSLTLVDSAVDSNGVVGSEFGDGGGIFIESTGRTATTRLILNNSSVTNNLAGGIFTELGTNSASVIKSSTIADNHGGSGLVAAGSSPNFRIDIFGSTIYGNTADLPNQPGSGSGWGIRNVDGIITIDQTVIDRNEGPYGSDQDYMGTLNSMKNSILGWRDSAMNIVSLKGINIIDTFANLDPVLRNNLVSGNVTQGRRPPLTHKPLQGSNCIDFTSSIDAVVGSQDQGHQNRGFDRVSGSANYDVGAVELQSGQ